MKRNALLLLGLMLATGLIAAGCGGDDDDGGDALTKEEYLAQGNAICEEGNKELEQTAEFDVNDPAALEAFVTDTFVPNVQGQIDELREGIPEGDEDQVTEILDEAELVLVDFQEDPSLLTGESGEDPFAPINTKLTDYGLTACAG